MKMNDLWFWEQTFFKQKYLIKTTTRTKIKPYHRSLKEWYAKKRVLKSIRKCGAYQTKKSL